MILVIFVYAVVHYRFKRGSMKSVDQERAEEAADTSGERGKDPQEEENSDPGNDDPAPEYDLGDRAHWEKGQAERYWE